MRPIWVVWMHWRPTLWEDMTPEEDAAIDAHTGYWKQLNEEGRVLVAGAIRQPPNGLAFFYADTPDEAKTVLDGDPLYQAKLVEMTLHEYGAGFVGRSEGFDFTQSN